MRAFAQEIYKNEDRLDILVNNAAVLEVGLHSMTANRQLLLMQVNYFSPFLLTNLLLGLYLRQICYQIATRQIKIAKI